MAILAAETNLFPADLLEQNCGQIECELEGNIDAPDKRIGAGVEFQRWWAVYTRSRREKDLMRRLLPWQVGFYCPIVATRQKSPAGRIRTSHLPLFSNYVFLYGTGEDRVAALSTNCVSQIFPVPDGRQLAADLRRLRDLIAAGLPVTLEQGLQAGDPIQVRSGPLRGFKGTVLRRRDETRFMVAVNFLQQGASVLLDECDIEPV